MGGIAEIKDPKSGEQIPMQSTGYAYEQIATQIEKDFNQYLKENRHGKFGYINDLFYENMLRGTNISIILIYSQHAGHLNIHTCSSQVGSAQFASAIF